MAPFYVTYRRVVLVAITAKWHVTPNDLTLILFI
jgi:hypothetical protein